MDGVFRKQGFTKVYNIIGLISGIFLILLFGFFICAGEFETLDDQIVSWFTATDWKLFSVMACCGVLMVAAACLLLRSYLLHTDKLHKLQGALYQTILQTSPLGPGNARKLFLDDEYNPTIRLTVYGYPNSSDVYFTVEHVTPNYETACIHESKIYSSLDELAPEIEGMTEIALP